MLSRLLIAALATLALLLVWRPAVLHAQSTPAAASEASTRVHVVKRGETLWGLAARYHGDGHQWQSLARSNGLSVAAEPSLRVGMRLKVPARPAVRGPKAGEVAAAPADSTVPKAALAKAGGGSLPPVLEATPAKSPAGSLAAQTAGKGNAGRTGARAASAAPVAPAAPTPAPSATTAKVAATADTGRAVLSPSVGTQVGERGARRVGLVDQEVAMASRKANEIETVFHRDLPDAAEAERRTRAVLRPNTPAPRVAEFQSAPFVMAAAVLAKAGRLAGRVGSSQSTGDAYPQRAIMTDQVELQAPALQSYKVGDRLIAFGPPSLLVRGQLLVQPTGVLEVVKAEAGKPALAMVRRQSGRIEEGQHLLPAPEGSAPWVKATRLDTPDVSATIAWLDPHEGQPTLQSFMLLSAGSAGGLMAGDELAIYRRIAQGTTEALAATVRVVRADRDHATAIITQQYQTDIAVGMTARRYAKAP
ncbi:LysM peptidoglycan-binding domain-containing protein [Gemmatimonas sp.]|uniref:LysM peptidoglycan-binding domain-containing protein n=1 Tax=Gemmatimonas sp. TaxID=1962908 RepID=UPI0037C10873